MTKQLSKIAFSLALVLGLAVFCSSPVVADEQPGDANMDGLVDEADFVIWNDNRFGTGEFSAGDFNGDGLVDVIDFNIWNENRTPQSENALVVPEPASAMMMVFSGLGLCWLGRRLGFGR